MNGDPDLFTLARDRAQAGVQRSAETSGDDWATRALEGKDAEIEFVAPDETGAQADPPGGSSGSGGGLPS